MVTLIYTWVSFAVLVLLSPRIRRMSDKLPCPNAMLRYGTHPAVTCVSKRFTRIPMRWWGKNSVIDVEREIPKLLFRFVLESIITSRRMSVGHWQSQSWKVLNPSCFMQDTNPHAHIHRHGWKFEYYCSFHVEINVKLIWLIQRLLIFTCSGTTLTNLVSIYFFLVWNCSVVKFLLLEMAIKAIRILIFWTYVFIFL
jgi:hypothetical protein